MLNLYLRKFIRLIFDRICCNTKEVTIIEDSDDGEYYSVRKEICSVDTQDEKILLS